MIYETIKRTAEAVPELAGSVFPTGACVDDVEAPFAIYSFGEQTEITDLSGNVHHYVDEILIYFFAATYDQVHALYRDAQKKMRSLANAATGDGQYIFGVTCEADKEDGLDLNLELMTRAMKVTVQWCDLE